MSNEKSGRVLSAKNAVHLAAALDHMKSIRESFEAMAQLHSIATAHLKSSTAHIDAIAADNEGSTPLTDNELSFDVERVKRSLKLAEMSLGNWRN
jgi:hypothetical protein